MFLHTARLRVHTFLLSALLALIASAVASAGNSHVNAESAPLPAHTVYTQRSVPSGDYFERIVQVKFRNDYTIRLRDGALVDLSGRAPQGELDSLAGLTFGAQWTRAHDVDEATLDTLRARGEANTGKPLPDVNNYFHLILPVGWTESDAIAQIERNPLVERVLRIPVPIPSAFSFSYVDPGGITGNNATDAYQRYLDPAPDGVDARYAWYGTGGSGSGIGVCDIEQDYNPDHADLPSINLRGATISFPGQEDDHGTAVLGIVAARNNGVGVTGIAYGASLYFAYGVYNQVNSTPDGINNVFFLHNAITRCTAALDSPGNDGDVILIEAQIAGPNRPANPPEGSQLGLVPTEWDESVYDVIKLAVANGITVVEAAGNGQQNLDDAVYQPGGDHHEPFVPGNDSGAIIVGAGKSPIFSAANARSAHDYSNYGQTVDLQGWGDNIVTTGYGTLYPGGANPDVAEKNQWYAISFGGTSGASPIVTGAAAVVQSTYHHVNGSYMTPAQVRTLLRNTGTAQQGAKNIGPLPNLRAAIEQIYSDAGEGLTVNAPTITPASGTYEMPMQVQIGYGAGQNGSNTNIRYTLDGSEPTPDSYILIPEQGDSVYLVYGATVKAKAFQYDPDVGRSFGSATTTRTYVSSTPKVETPVITPGGGYYDQPHQVTLSTNTPGAEIRYRTDGRLPSFFYPGTLYTGPITLQPGTYEITARGYRDGYYKSDAAESGEVVVSPTVLPVPTIYPNGGTFNGSVLVHLSTTFLGATIRYTTDGSEPDASDPTFVEPIILATGDNELVVTVRAKVFRDGYTPSPTASATFTILGKAEAPTINPAGGTHNVQVEVSITTNEAGGETRYTTNGAEPAPFSALYTAPFVLGPGVHTVKAKTFVEGIDPSNTTTQVFTIYASDSGTVETPRIIPGGGNHTISVTVRLESDTAGADIYYTTSDSGLPPVPTTADSLFDPNNPIVLTANENDQYVRARAFKTGMSPSNDVYVPFRVFTAVNTAMTPTVNLPGGVYTEPIQVQVFSNYGSQFFEPKNTIYYTTDGTAPFVPANTIGAIPPLNLNLSQATQLKAIAAQLGWYNSPLLDETYTFVCDTPQVTPGGVYTGPVQVEMSTNTPSAVIRYTTDDSEPDGSSTQYTTPLNLGVGTTTLRVKCFRTNFDPSNTILATYIVQPNPVAPTITQEPQSQEVDSGATVTFTVDATGTPTPTIQWQFKGLDIAGENEPELVLHNVNDDHSGEYRAIASNEADSATSAPASLSLKPEAIAGLTAVNDGPTTVGSPTMLTANVTAGSNVSYQWDFGDGMMGSGRVVSHTYASAGVYTATVNASNEVNSDSAQTVVTVVAAPIAVSGLTANNDSPTVLGTPTNFAASVSAGTGVQYTWDFGDGNGGSGAAPAHVYDSVGSYTAVVTASNSLNSETTTTEVEIVGSAVPVSNLQASNDGPTEFGHPTRFSASADGSSVTYSWDFGDGNTGNGPNPTHTYAAPGEYVATVTAGNTINNLKTTTEVTVEAKLYLPGVHTKE